MKWRWFVVGGLLLLMSITSVGFVQAAALSADEISWLTYMREEEKLARDVYIYLYNMHGSTIFYNISNSEQTHMDAIKALLDRYGITDPAEEKGVGEFTNPEFKILYDALIGRGDDSLVEALLVGVFIEETDIQDLEVAIGLATRRDIKKVYSNLLQGSLKWALKNGDIDFALQDPHTYVSLAKSYNRGSLLRTLTKDGKTSQYGLIIARKGSGINHVRDLRGKTVMFGPKLSSTKWIAAKEMFKEYAINIDKDLTAYSNGGCCEDIAFNVYLKAVDAGVVCDPFLEEHSDKQKELGINVKQLIVIGRTGPVPTKIFAARRELNTGIVAKINQMLLNLDRNLPAHAEILHPAELGGFQKARDEDYDGIRAVVGAKR
jgi:hypothetical protein